jgi:LDH2 family malate/lactate/ureidoglycolate dehydrogenase
MDAIGPIETSKVPPGACSMTPALTGQTGTNMNGVAAALDTAAFLNDVDTLGQTIAAQPTCPGTQRRRLPGRRGDAVRAERERIGIPLPSGTWSGLAAAARGIAMPHRFSDTHFRNIARTCYRARR